MNWTDEQDKQLLDMRKKGLSYSECAKAFGVSRRAISGKLHRLHGYKRPSDPGKTKRAKKEPNHNLIEPWAVFHARKVAERAAAREAKLSSCNQQSDPQSPEK